MTIYRLISSNTVEERVLARARQKMVLDALVIQKRGGDGLADVLVDNDAEGEEDMAKMGVEELWKMLSDGAAKVFDPSVEEAEDLSASDFDQLISSAQPAKWDDKTGDDSPSDEAPTDLSKLNGTIFAKKKPVGRPKKTEAIDLLSSDDDASVPGAVDTSFSDSGEESTPVNEKKRKVNPPWKKHFETVAVASEVVGGKRRSKRAKVAPTLFEANYFEKWTPGKKAKIIHDSDCFCCRKVVVKPPKANGKNGKAPAVPHNAGLECIACPRVYHMKCSGESRRPKTKAWYCPWHSCVSCNRKKTDAGGTLL